MSNLGDFLANMVQRGHQAVQDRAALGTLSQFMNDQDDQQSDAMAQRGKQANALRNVLKSYNPDDPNIGHTLNGMGVDQLEGVMHGMAMNSAMQQAQAEMGRNQAMSNWYNQRVQESAGEGDALSEFARNLAPALSGGGGAATAPGFGETTGGSMLPGAPSAGMSNFAPGTQAAGTGGNDINGAVLNAMANMGSTNPRMAGVMLGKILPAIMGNAAAGKQNFFNAKDQPQTYGDWQRIPTGPNASQLVYNDPSGGQLTPQFDDDNTLVGWSQNDARGHSRFIASKGENSVKAAMDGDGNPIPGFFIDAQGKVIDARTQMQHDGLPFGTPQAPAAPKAAGAPKAPQVGEVRSGFKFKGGDPSDKGNWEKQ